MHCPIKPSPNGIPPHDTTFKGFEEARTLEWRSDILAMTADHIDNPVILYL